MASRILQSDLTKEQVKKIEDSCIIYSKSSQFKESEAFVCYRFEEPFFFVPFEFGVKKKNLAKREIQFKGTLREEQVPVVEEATKYLEHKGSCFLALPTNFGKTFIGIYLALDPFTIYPTRPTPMSHDEFVS